MNYIGSKLSLLPFLEKSINQIVDKDCKIFCDLFAGTGIVGTHFKKKGYKIIANDLQYYSYVLNKQYIDNHEELEFNGLVAEIPDLQNINIADRKDKVCFYLSNMAGKKGFIYQNYSLSGTKGKEFERLYFSDENAKKCDALRDKIQDWSDSKKINEKEYFFLLASLLEVVDKHANTASVYGAFLKEMKKSAQKVFSLIPANLIINEQAHKVFNEDANSLIKKIETDILYLDPPYNERQYCSNYHILETIAKNDKPLMFGKTGLRDYKKQKSEYCSKRTVRNAFEDLILNAKARYIFLSYNNEGLLSLDDVKEIMSQKGKYGFFTQGYNRFKADKNRNYKTNKTVEYLHYCICDK